LWTAGNVTAGAVSGLFFVNYFAATTVPADGSADTIGLRLALALFGPWAATGLAFGAAHWLVLRQRYQLQPEWLPVAPFAGLGYMATQFLISLTTGWLLGSVAAALVAAVASGWIIGALQWMLMDEPDVSANRWVAASAIGAVAAALIWYPGFPWSLSLLSTTAAGAIAGGLYSLPGAVVLMTDHARQRRVLAAPVAR
jgi:hypothetical protein